MRNCLDIPAWTGRSRTIAVLAKKILAVFWRHIGPVRLSFLSLLLLFSLNSLAAERVALVIGNNDYDRAPLSNPINDATELSKAFKDIGFDKVLLRTDTTRDDLEDAIDDFNELASEAEIAVVFYAGHGIQVDGESYIMPIDVELRKKRDIRKLVSLQELTEEAGQAAKLGVVILDACRDNPFAAQLSDSLGRSLGGRGLSRVDVDEENTYVAYATRANAIADDGVGDHSPYTSALLKYIRDPDLEIRRLFGKVRDEVKRSTRNQQVPFTYGSLGGDEYFLAGKAPVEENLETESTKPVVVGSSNDQVEIEKIFWQTAEKEGGVEFYQVYLESFPEGVFSVLARRKIELLNKEAEQRERVAAEVEQSREREADEERQRLAAEEAARREQEKRQADLEREKLAADEAAAAERAKEQARILQVAEEAARREEEKRLADLERERLAAEETAAAERAAEQVRIQQLAEEAARLEEQQRQADQEREKLAAEDAVRKQAEQLADQERLREESAEAANRKRLQVAADQQLKDAESTLGLTRSRRRDVQEGLNLLGYSVGSPDGLWGKRTRGALVNWQRKNGYEASGYLDQRSYSEFRKQLDAANDKAAREQRVKSQLAEREKPTTTAIVDTKPVRVDPIKPVSSGERDKNLKRFSLLKRAIENKSMSGVLALTNTSTERRTLLEDLFRQSEKIELALDRILIDNKQAKISARLKIVSLGSDAGLAPSSYDAFDISCRREGAGWSRIDW